MYPIEGFPIDGRLWWLRWFDHPAWNGITSAATVTVALSRLPRATHADALPLCPRRLRRGRAHSSRATSTLG